MLLWSGKVQAWERQFAYLNSLIHAAQSVESFRMSLYIAKLSVLMPRALPGQGWIYLCCYHFPEGCRIIQDMANLWMSFYELQYKKRFNWQEPMWTLMSKWWLTLDMLCNSCGTPNWRHRSVQCLSRQNFVDFLSFVYLFQIDPDVSSPDFMGHVSRT